MAQNITLLGASYSDVPAVLLPKTGGGTARFDDASITTAAASDVASGKLFLASDGTITTGTGSGGGSSSWTLLGSKEFTVSTTTTTTTETGSIECGSAASTKAKIIYVRVRDKAGKRAGYFYGSDAFFINYQKANGSTTQLSNAGRIIHRYTTASKWAQYSAGSTTGYGVFGYGITNAGKVQIYQRYSSSYSTTIDGTYKVEVYALDWPDGISPYDA